MRVLLMARPIARPFTLIEFSLFWMPFSEFCRHYESLYLCRVFRDVSWHK